MSAKSIWASKTFWLNLLVALATFVVEVSPAGPELGVDPKWVLIAVTAANIILRYVTTQPVTLSRAPES